MDNNQLIRDIKLNLIDNKSNVSIAFSRLYPSGYFIFRNRKIIKDFIKRGFILTGSRALNCYSLNGNRLIDRKPKDWDFLITQEQLFEVCKDYKIYNFDINSKVMKFKKSFMALPSSSYTYTEPSKFIIRCNIQLIVEDDLPS